jgi:ferredoxin
VNTKFADIWPNITMRKDAPADADDWLQKANKFAEHFSENPGNGD